MIAAVYKNKTTGEITQGIFQDENEIQEHKAKYGYMYDAQDYDVILTDISQEMALKEKKAKRKKVREFCLDLMDDIAILNETADETKMNTILTKPEFVMIIIALLTGSPKSAAKGMAAYGEQVYTKEQVDAFVQKVNLKVLELGLS